MLRKLWQFTKRFRWPLAGALVTLLMLYWWMQPRPREEIGLPSSESPVAHNVASVRVSPSGKYLLAAGDLDARLRLYDLGTKRLIFAKPRINSDVYGFDASDQLAFASFGTSTLKPDDTILELWHWKPGQTEPRQLSHRQAFPPGMSRSIRYDAREFNGLFPFGQEWRYPFGRNGIILCLLSPDTHTWLVPKREGAEVFFELIDAETGKVRARLDMPAFHIEQSTSPKLEASFSLDSKLLITQVQRKPARVDEERYALECYDVGTGKKTMTLQVPGEAEFGFLHQSNGRFNSLYRSDGDGMNYIQIIAQDQNYQLVQLAETQGLPYEVSWPGADDSK